MPLSLKFVSVQIFIFTLGHIVKTVLTYGTFDLFHIGHLKILERAGALGDQLIVGVSSDTFNDLKGKKSIFPYAHRAEIVGALSFVSKVIPEDNWNQKAADIQNHNVDVLVMGGDWEGKFDDLRAYCDVIYLPRTTGVSTTEIKQALRPFQTDDLKKALETLQTLVAQLEV